MAFYSALPGCLGKEWLYDLLHFTAFTLRTLNFLCFMFLDGQDFGKFFAAFAAGIFVEGHKFSISYRLFLHF